MPERNTPTWPKYCEACVFDGRSNAYVEAMNGLLQQAKPATRWFRTVEKFLAIAYLCMSKLKHLPANPVVPAVALNFWRGGASAMGSRSTRKGIEPSKYANHHLGGARSKQSINKINHLRAQPLKSARLRWHRSHAKTSSKFARTIFLRTPYLAN